MKKTDRDTKVAMGVASGILALFAIEKFFKHPTFGNGLRGFVAMVSFATG